MRLGWMAIFWVVVAAPAGAAELVRTEIRIEGLLREKGTRTPLRDASVFVLPQKLKAVTDHDGHFVVEGVAEGDFQLVVNLAGYERLERHDHQDSGAPNPLRELYAEKMRYSLYETVITDREVQRDDKTKSLSQKEFMTAPGAGGDPIKAVQNLPGVTRPTSFSSQVMIEGSAPQDTIYTVNGHEVPIIFHFGGLSSVVMPDALERVDYLSAGFGPEYGRATAGLVGVWTKSPETDRVHGLSYVDLLNAGLMVEGPVGDDSSFLFAGRHSYVGYLIGVFSRRSNLDFTVVPTFSDVTGIYEKRFSPQDKFNLALIGSMDALEFARTNVSSAAAAARGTFSLFTSFYRAIPEWTHYHSADTISRYSLGLGEDWVKTDFGTSNSYQQVYALTPRIELETRLMPSWQSFWGLDDRHSWTNTHFLIGSTVGTPTQETTSGADNDVGLYWRNTIHASDSPWTWMPGFRLDYFSGTHELAPAPRLAARHALTPSLNLRAATGLYIEPPLFFQADPTRGNPDILGQRAVHLTAGFEKDFRGGSTNRWTVSSDVFYKDLYDLIIPSATLVTRNGALTPENYDNSGFGHAYGIEMMARFSQQPWSGWISYTLERSTRGQPGVDEHLFQYDQTHNLTAVGQVELGKTWTMSSRLRFTSGDPLTPIDGSIFDSDRSRYSPIPGDPFSTRLAPFFSLDVRFDKKWIYDKWILTAYLDIQNVTNHQNPEAISYNYNYTQSAYITLLPFLPTFGVKGEF